ncbi:serine protease 48-like isoform X2 [Drosophila miranda]|uniref:serine protease 48-like isoform X2 n=1 Tax=Drosophila miranda TaxID=7229 RepID=UPI00143F88F3|nr:serine protease 48-like isoform X2 [Drosophila miranda]
MAKLSSSKSRLRMRRSRILEKPVSRLMGLWEEAELQSRVAYQQQILDGGCWKRFNDAIVDTVETGCLFRLELLNFRFEFLDGHRSAVIFGVKRASRCCAKASAFSSVVLHQGSAGACCPSATCLLTGRFGMGCLLIALNVTLTGWGAPENSLTTVERLQTLNLTIIDHEECRKAWDYHEGIDIGHICTLTSAGEWACSGDSGSPIMWEGKLVGLVNWGRPCGVGLPDMYANTVYYPDCIRRTPTGCKNRVN